jgi:hypothetical protein
MQCSFLETGKELYALQLIGSLGLENPSESDIGSPDGDDCQSDASDGAGSIPSFQGFDQLPGPGGEHPANLDGNRSRTHWNDIRESQSVQRIGWPMECETR